MSFFKNYDENFFCELEKFGIRKIQHENDV